MHSITTLWLVGSAATLAALTACGNDPVEARAPAGDRSLAVDTHTAAAGLAPAVGPRRTLGVGAVQTPLARATLEPFHVHANENDFMVQLMSKQSVDVVVTDGAIQPNGSTGWHTHPGPVFVAITAGALTLYEGSGEAARHESCVGTVYPAGTAFVDPGGGHVHIARNEGRVTATFVATYLAPVGAAVRIDVPAPGNCPF